MKRFFIFKRKYQIELGCGRVMVVALDAWRGRREKAYLPLNQMVLNGRSRCFAAELHAAPREAPVPFLLKGTRVTEG